MSRRTALIAAGVGVAMVLVWFFLLWAPRSQAIQDANDRREAAQLRQDDLRVQISRLKAAAQDEPAKRARIEALRAAIPEEPDLGQFILDTNDAASRSGIEFISIAPSEPAVSGSLQAPAPITANLAVSGGYFQVLDFLNRMNALPRLVVTKDITVGGRQDTGRLTVNLLVEIYTTGALEGAPAPAGTGAGAGGSPDSTSSTTSTTVNPS